MERFESVHNDDLIRIGSWDSYFDSKSKEPPREGSVLIYRIDYNSMNQRADTFIRERVEASRKYEAL